MDISPVRPGGATLPEMQGNRLVTAEGPTVILGRGQGKEYGHVDVNGLKREPDEPGLLGQDIIPLSGLVTPHQQKDTNTTTTTPIIISDPAPSPSREAVGGGLSSILSHQQPQQQQQQQPQPANMIFSDLYKSPRSPFSKLRSSHPHAACPPDIDADLISKDKAKSKEAVRKFLAEKIRNDWEFDWPQQQPPSTTSVKEEPAEQVENAPLAADGPTSPGPTTFTADNNNNNNNTTEETAKDSGEEADSEDDDSDAESIYSTISEDPLHFQPRLEWTSDLSDDDEGIEPRAQATSPFRFDSPEDVGTAVHCTLENKRTKRRRALREETTWNPGLACFEARRDAWTGAKTVRVKPKPASPVSPSSTRRIFWRSHHRTESSASQTLPSSPPSASPLDQGPPVRTSQQTDLSVLTPPLSESDSTRQSNDPAGAASILYPVQTLVPVPAPLLPPQNPMRSSIIPSMYPSLYDKLVVQGLQPACPVNLSDMIRACVVGWKRDGEWPPRSMYPPPVAVPSAAELAAIRQRKAAQQKKIDAQRRKEAARDAGAANVGVGATVRRLSFGLLGGSGKPVEKVVSNEEKGQGSNSDESAGKGGFRRSLQRVLSLGSSSHGGGGSVAHPAQHQQQGKDKEATVAGMAAALV